MYRVRRAFNRAARRDANRRGGSAEAAVRQMVASRRTRGLFSRIRRTSVRLRANRAVRDRARGFRVWRSTLGRHN